jgi:hypothetical protein
MVVDLRIWVEKFEIDIDKILDKCYGQFPQMYLGGLRCLTMNPRPHCLVLVSVSPCQASRIKPQDDGINARRNFN